MNISKSSWIMAIVVFSVLVLVLSHAFVYIEGDDARSIAYHVLGRDATVQDIYNEYQGMLDKVLTPLPSNESFLRVLTFSLSAISTICLVIFILSIAFQILNISDNKIKLYVASATSLAVPELFFLMQTYHPAIISMAILLGLHKWIRDGIQGRLDEFWLLSKRTYIISLAVFGFAVSCRWDSLVYGLVIAVDMFVSKLLSSNGNLKNSLLFPFMWGIPAIISSLLFVMFSGQNLSDIIAILGFMQANPGGANFSTISAIGAAQPFFTPALLIGLFLGFYLMLRKNLHVFLLALSSFILVFVYIGSGVPKMFLYAFPGFLIFFAAGSAQFINWAKSSKIGRITLGLFVLALITPWILGAQVYSASTSWGPGFEVRMADDEAWSNLGDQSSNSRSGKKIVFGAGTAVPTQEGPRSLWGFGKVLIGGDWRKLALERNRIGFDLIERARNEKLAIYSESTQDYTLVNLVNQGYSTQDPAMNYSIGELLSKRTFTSKSDTIEFFNSFDAREGAADEKFKLLRENAGDEVILYVRASSYLRELWSSNPEALELISPFSAYLHLDRLGLDSDSTITIE